MDREELDAVLEENNKTLMASMQEFLQGKITPAPEAKPEDKPQEDPNKPIDIKAFAAELVSQMSEGQSNKAIELMYDEKFKTELANNPGLKEFLDDTDDYGSKRIDQISAGTFEEKSQKLNAVVSAYNQAKAAGGGQAPSVSPEITKQIEETETKYDTLFDKLNTGELTQGELQSQFLQELDAEMEKVMAG